MRIYRDFYPWYPTMHSVIMVGYHAAYPLFKNNREDFFQIASLIAIENNNNVSVVTQWRRYCRNYGYRELAAEKYRWTACPRVPRPSKSQWTGNQYTTTYVNCKCSICGKRKGEYRASNGKLCRVCYQKNKRRLLWT